MHESKIPAVASAMGFSDLEVRIYCELLRTGPATGYGVAKALGRAGANVYQGLATLQQKGAVLTADAATKAYRALPPAELVATIARGHRARLAQAQEALETIERAPPDDALYQLSSIDQAYERAYGMVGGAQRIVLFDLFPKPFAMLASHLEQAVARGVRVAGMVYEPPAQQHASWAFEMSNGPLVKRLWPGQGMILASDAQRCLISLLSHDNDALLHGVWTDSPYLSCVQHSGLGTDLRLNMLLRDYPDPMPEVSLLNSGAPGLEALAARVTDRTSPNENHVE